MLYHLCYSDARVVYPNRKVQNYAHAQIKKLVLGSKQNRQQQYHVVLKVRRGRIWVWDDGQAGPCMALVHGILAGPAGPCMVHGVGAWGGARRRAWSLTRVRVLNQYTCFLFFLPFFIFL